MSQIPHHVRDAIARQRRAFRLQFPAAPRFHVHVVDWPFDRPVRVIVDVGDVKIREHIQAAGRARRWSKE